MRTEVRTKRHDEAKSLFSQFCEGAEEKYGSSALLTLDLFYSDIWIIRQHKTRKYYHLIILYKTK
jgi:hypothetical protein